MKSIFLLACLLSAVMIVAGCTERTDIPTNTPMSTGGEPTTTFTVTPLPEPTITASPSAEPVTVQPTAIEATTAESSPTAVGDVAMVTPTPYPGATPTSGPLNDPVPTVAVGEYECGAYPCFDDAANWVARIEVPPGFNVRYVSQIEPHPTSFAFGPDGLLYVARQEGEIVTVNAEGNVEPYVEGFYYLVAIAFQPGTNRLFAASRAEGNDAAIIWVIEDGEAEPLYDDLPCCYGDWHQANGIAFGPDGYGYIALGALSDHGENQPLHPLEASILRFDPAGDSLEVFASGVRNTFDITWDGSGRLFGADNMPDHGPPEEFNRLEQGGHYGFPYYDCPTCTPPPPDLEIIPPVHDLLAHSAPTGLTSYLAEQFPGYYNNIFLTLWSAFPGAQKIVRFGPGGEGMTDFATGFAAPVDVTVSPEGNLFVADWASGILFEISYTDT